MRIDIFEKSGIKGLKLHTFFRLDLIRILMHYHIHMMENLIKSNAPMSLSGPNNPKAHSEKYLDDYLEDLVVASVNIDELRDGSSLPLMMAIYDKIHKHGKDKPNDD